MSIYTNSLLAFQLYLHQYVYVFSIFTSIDFYDILQLWWRSEPISTILYYYLERGANMPEESKVSKAQQKAVNKYVKNNYDRINVTFPKGQKEIIMQAAEAAGESVNGYIKKAVDQRMERDNA